MPSERESHLLAKVDAVADRFVSLCSRLVQVNSVNPYAGEKNDGSEAACQDVVEDVLRSYEPQPTVERFDPPSGVYERAGFIGPQGRDFRNRPIVTADWDFGEHRGNHPSIILNDHVDTVGVEGMTIDPFSGEIRDGKIWGRGSTDSKGGLVTGLWAIQALLDCGVPLCGRLSFESVVDEECNGSGAGTLACRLRGRRADEAIVLDGDAAIVHGCDGVITVDFHVKGRAGHSGIAGSSVNAIEKALRVKQGIDTWKAKRLKRYPIEPNLGVFRAGTVPSMVPGEAYMSMNALYGCDEADAALRTAAAHSGEPLYNSLTDHVRQIEEADEWLREHPTQITWVKDLPPFRIPADHPLVTGLEKAHRGATGSRTGVRTITSWTDAAHFIHQAQMPVVMFGTGAECAHASVEYVEIETMRRNAATLALFLLRRLSAE